MKSRHKIFLTTVFLAMFAGSAMAATATGTVTTINTTLNPVPITLAKDGGGTLNLNVPKNIIGTVSKNDKVNVTYSGSNVSAISKAGTRYCWPTRFGTLSCAP